MGFSRQKYWSGVPSPSFKRADLGTCGARAVPDHCAREHPDTHKEATSTEHQGGCGPHRTLAKGNWPNKEWVRRKILDVQWNRVKVDILGQLIGRKNGLGHYCIAPLTLVKQDLKAQTRSLSQPIGFRDPGRDFPGLRDRVEFCSLWSQGMLRVMSLVWLGQGDGPQILETYKKH